MRALFFVAIALASCARAPSSEPASPAPSSSAASSVIAKQSVASTAPSASASVAAAPPAPAVKQTYPWLEDATLSFPAAVDSLSARFAPPSGFSRVDLAPTSFGAFLRDLPLAAEGTPVVSFSGATLHPATDSRIAAVVAIDVGNADLQQCADSVIRMHAEWRWAHGKRDHVYRAASGAELPYARWVAGDRLLADGMSVAWKKMTKAGSADDHALFRGYLAGVFGWANTGSLSKQAAKVDVADLAPGDFVVWPGAPGHAVLVLDLARASDGRRVALLGQGYMPAQSFQVLRSPSGSPWFAIDPSAPLDTPFWDPFPWSDLRRLGE